MRADIFSTTEQSTQPEVMAAMRLRTREAREERLPVEGSFALLTLGRAERAAVSKMEVDPVCC